MSHLDTEAGKEELAHLEMIGTIIKQLTQGASTKEIEESGMVPYC